MFTTEQTGLQQCLVLVAISRYPPHWEHCLLLRCCSCWQKLGPVHYKYIISKCTVESDTQLAVQGQHPTALGNELMSHIHLSQMYLQTTTCLTQ